MKATEFHRYSYRNRFGKCRLTRHWLDAETARQQLGADAVPIAGTLEVRQVLEPGDPLHYNTTQHDTGMGPAGCST